MPEVVSGVLLAEAQKVWQDWNPLAWQMIKLRGLLTEPHSHDNHVHVRPAHKRSIWQSLQMLFARTGHPPVEREAPDARS